MYLSGTYFLPDTLFNSVFIGLNKMSKFPTLIECYRTAGLIDIWDFLYDDDSGAFHII